MSSRRNHLDRLPQVFRVLTWLTACCIVPLGAIENTRGADPLPDGQGQLLAGAYAKNINPRSMPVWVNGGIAGKQVDRIHDPLHARSLVLSDGKVRLAICIVDNCVLPLDIVDSAKQRVRDKIGLEASHVLIAATHTHSAVSVSGAHGTPVQEDYAAELPGWIADSIIEAHARMVPAKWGTATVTCDQYIYCRDWLMKPGKANSSPFSGRASDSVNMNPGYDNPNKLAPIGPVDTLVPILSIQDMEGHPISVLATFCTHYAGAPDLSADYFGVVCERLASSLRPGSPDAFVGLMSNSTSGNANCVDFSKPRVPFTHVDVGNYVAEKILSVVPGIEYSPKISLDAELNAIELAVRMPSESEVTTAKRYVESRFPDRLPTTLDESYARETVLLSQMPPVRKLNLQAFRLGDFLISANPCEAYNETGLKLRQSSPFRLTMNIGLANGHAGYIPPPELYQLGGYTTWRCRTSCLEEQAEPKMVEGLVRAIQTLHARFVTLANPGPTPPKIDSPVASSESLKWLETQPGFRVELVASEPQIVDPVSMQIDEQGRMWVVEMRDYPVEDATPKSRIVVLQDKDRDGFFESSQVFADQLRFATGVQPWQNGVLVTVQGQLLMLRDVDGDLKADVREVWIDGFSTGNPQLRANHPVIASDGWLYIASGLRGGKVTSSIPFANSESVALDLTGSDLRVNMHTGKIESIAGPSQFGLTFDRLGHRYGCSNRQPCFEILSERSELGMSPLAGLVGPLHEVSPGDVASRVLPLVNAWTTSNLHAGQFTAACGVLVTHSQHFQDTPFATALTCEPTGGLVQRRSFARRDGRSRVSDNPSDQEWLASRDPWFRPVDLFEGPNGDIYVVDMYRAVIEHPEWVPVELKKRPDERFGESHGRIYRVTRSNPKPDAPSAHTFEKTKPDIIAWLQHPDTWNRNIASRLFVEAMQRGRDETLIAKMREIVSTGDPSVSIGSVANISALLSTYHALDEATILSLLKSTDSARREVGWSCLRQSSQNWAGRWNEEAANAIAAPDVALDEAKSIAWFVATQVSQSDSSREAPNSRFIENSAKALLLHANEPHLWMAVTAACKNRLDALLASWMGSAGRSQESDFTAISREALTRLATRVAQQLSEVQLNELADGLANDAFVDATSATRRLPVLEGFVRSGKLSIAEGGRLEQSLLRAAISNTDAVGRAAISMLAGSKSNEAKRIALKLLGSTDSSIVKLAISTCSSHDTPEFKQWLLERFPSALPDIRQDIFAAIRSKPHRLESLVDQLESGAMSTRLLDASQIQNLKGVKDTAIGPRLTKLLAASVDSNRQKVIDDFSTHLATIQVDPKNNRGRAVFEKNCSVCHRLNSVGTSVGPDISDSRVHTFEKLLVSILDPNRSIDANYFRYMARTEDGKVVEGLLKDANAQTVTLQNQNGATTLDRSEIEELKSSGTSLMPDGIEAQIPVSEMAELLWYIKNWRYAAENVPANVSLAK